jgi:hypothetical protein
MVQTKLIKHGGNEFLMLFMDNKWWYVAKQMADYLEYSESSKALKLISDNHKVTLKKKGNEDIFKYICGVLKMGNKTTNISFIDKDGIITLIESCSKLNSTEKKELLSSIIEDNSIYLINNTRSEIKFFKKLNYEIYLLKEEFDRKYPNFKEINPFNKYKLELQKNVCCNKYRMDCYINNLFLAIEYDEKYHKYQETEDKERELEISRWFYDNDNFTEEDYEFARENNIYDLGEMCYGGAEERDNYIEFIRVKKGIDERKNIEQIKTRIILESMGNSYCFGEMFFNGNKEINTRKIKKLIYNT